MKIFIIISIVFLYGCSTKESPSFKSGADVNKQTYLLSCPNDMLINLTVYKDSKTFQFLRTSAASFATQNVVIEKNEGTVELSDKNNMRLVPVGATKKVMLLGFKKNNFFTLKYFDESNSNAECEGGLFESVY